MCMSSAGEADPIPMSVHSKNDAPHESHNIAFMSSQVLNGEGFGIVIRCGDDTFIGKINTLALHTAPQETTMVKDIRLFVTFIAIFASTLAIILFSIGLIRGTKFADAFVNGLVVVLVANIPQGLPATVTAMLSSTAAKMKEKRVVVKRPDIVESLGAATRIASDKTGTLTQNKMTVMNCWVNRQFKSSNEILANRPSKVIAQLHRRSGGMKSARNSGSFTQMSVRSNSGRSKRFAPSVEGSPTSIMSPRNDPANIHAGSRRTSEDFLPMRDPNHLPAGAVRLASDQFFCFSRCIGEVTPKNIYFD